MHLVRECLEIALQAPSGSNAQRWHWIVVTDPGQRQAIGAIYRRAFEAYAQAGGTNPDRYAEDPARQAVQRRVGASAAWLGEHMGEVPVQVIACRQVSSLAAGNQADIWGSLLPAAWSYMLAARARRLGTAWTTLHLDREDEVAQLLGIPHDVRQGVLIPTAFYTGETFKPAPREPLDTVLHMDRW